MPASFKRRVRRVAKEMNTQASIQGNTVHDRRGSTQPCLTSCAQGGVMRQYLKRLPKRWGYLCSLCMSCLAWSLPSLFLVSVGFGTGIPTSLYIWEMFWENVPSFHCLSLVSTPVQTLITTITLLFQNNRCISVKCTDMYTSSSSKRSSSSRPLSRACRLPISAARCSGKFPSLSFS